MSVKLGTIVTDRITGFQGIAVCRIEYLNGCVRYGVQPAAIGNKIEEPTYIDEQQLTAHSGVTSGGPGSVPPSPHKL
jgi:hypothetical protein